MKIGLVITTYNRSAYTKQCFESIVNSLLPKDLFIVLVDDFSKEKEAFDLFYNFDFKDIQVIRLRNKINLGVANSLKIGFDTCMQMGAKILVNLDNDAVVKSNWLVDLIYVYSMNSKAIVSGFNTLSKDPSINKTRHPIIEEFDSYCKKKSIGGINMLFNTETYIEKIKPALEKRGHWDWNVCKNNVEFYVTKPSVIQHIGIDKGTNLNNPDIAYDF